jgi:hypothetical protein
VPGLRHDADAAAHAHVGAPFEHGRCGFGTSSIALAKRRRSLLLGLARHQS